MAAELCNTGLVLALAHIPVADNAITAARAEDGLVPCQAADTVGVTHELTDLLAASGIPNLNLGIRSANSQMRAVRSPLHAGDVVTLVLARAQLFDRTGSRVEEVDGRAKGNCYLQGTSKTLRQGPSRVVQSGEEAP